MIRRDVATTERLLSHAARGSCLATVELFDSELETMYETACLLLGAPGDALEIVRQSVSAAVDNLGEVKDASRFSSWTRTLVVSRTLQHIVEHRTPFLDIESVENEPMWGELWADLAPPEVLDFFLSAVCPHEPEADDAAPDSLRQILRLQLQSLPDDLRIVFVLNDVLGFRANETAVFLGVSPENVKNLLAAARYKLTVSVSKTLRSMAAAMGGSDVTPDIVKSVPEGSEIGAC